MITIVNYGSGNIEAISNIYKRLNIPFTVADNPSSLNEAQKLLLPGVGAFDRTMSLLNESGLRSKLDELVLEKEKPVLGICVGMQIMGNKSDEGKLAGLGWIDGDVKKIDTSQFSHKPHLPHMGWNSITPKINHFILNDIKIDKGFYFLHSYHFTCKSTNSILCTTHYGEEFISGVFNKNIYGMQFHPEKSHMNGITLLKNFALL